MLNEVNMVISVNSAPIPKSYLRLYDRGLDYIDSTRASFIDWPIAITPHPVVYFTLKNIK
jgi:hypothetical protein